MAIGGTEALAGDLIGDRSSSLGASAYGFASGLGTRYGDFGAYRELSGYGLLEQIYDRWSMPDRLANGIEIFDVDSMGSLVNEWSVSPGYWDLSLTDSSPFVIPVDPVSNVRGLSARQVRTSRRRRSMFAVPAQRTPLRSRRSPKPAISAEDAPLVTAADIGFEPEPETIPALGPEILGPKRTQPAERWRAVDETRLTAYPKAMGRAGSVEASLLKFAGARAHVRQGQRTAIVAAPTPSVDWSPGDGLAPAARGAELMLEDLGNRLAPKKPSPVTHWLVPVDAPLDLAEKIAERHVSAGPARWMQIGNVPVAPIGRPDEARRDWTEPSGVLVDPRVLAPVPTGSPMGMASTMDSPITSKVATTPVTTPTKTHSPVDVVLQATQPEIQLPGVSTAPDASSAPVRGQPRGSTPSVMQGIASPVRPLLSGVREPSPTPLVSSTRRFLEPVRAAIQRASWPPMPASVTEVTRLGETIVAGTARWSTAALDASLGFVDEVVGVPSSEAQGAVAVQNPRVIQRFADPGGPWDRAGVLLTPSMVPAAMIPSAAASAVMSGVEARVGQPRTSILRGPTTPAPSVIPGGVRTASPTGQPTLGRPSGLTPASEGRSPRSDFVETVGVDSHAPSAIESPTGSTDPTRPSPLGSFSPRLTTPRPVVAMLETLLGRWTGPTSRRQPVIAAAARTVARILGRLVGEQTLPTLGASQKRPELDLYTETGAFVVPPPAPALATASAAISEASVVRRPLDRRRTETALDGVEDPGRPQSVSRLPFDPRLSASGGIVVSNDPASPSFAPNLPPSVTALLAAQGVDLESPWITWVDRLDAKLSDHFVGPKTSTGSVPKVTTLVDAGGQGEFVTPQASAPTPMASVSPGVDSAPGARRRPPRVTRTSDRRPTQSLPMLRSRPRPVAPIVVSPQSPAASPLQAKAPRERGQTTAHRLLRPGFSAVEIGAGSSASASMPGKRITAATSVGRIAALGQESPSPYVEAVSPYSGWPAHLIRVVESFADEHVADLASGVIPGLPFDGGPEREYVESSSPRPSALGPTTLGGAPEQVQSAVISRPRRAPGTTGLAVWSLSQRLSDDRPQMGLTHQLPAGRTSAAGGARGHLDGFESTLVQLGGTSTVGSSPSIPEAQGSIQTRAPASAAPSSSVDLGVSRSGGVTRAFGQFADGSGSGRPGVRPRRSAFGRPMSLSVPLRTPSRKRSTSPSNMDVLSLVTSPSSPLEGRAPRRLSALWAAAVEATRDFDAVRPMAGGGQGRPQWTTVEVGRLEESSPSPDVGARRHSAQPVMVTPENVSRALVAYSKAHTASGGQPGQPGGFGAALDRAGQHVDSGRPRTGPKAPMSFIEAPRTPGKLFGDRGPQQVKPPADRPRVMVDTSGAQALTEAMMRSTGADLPARPKKASESRHRLAAESEGDLSPEEIETVAEEVITILKREAEFNRLVLGNDEWD